MTTIRGGDDENNDGDGQVTATGITSIHPNTFHSL